jgi:hypothetical protein
MKLPLSVAMVLLWCAPALSADVTPPVFLSHFNIALDQKTYDALRISPEIAELASVAEKHTTAGDDTWTGFYIYGRQTYMEFFGADNLPEGTHLGDCALALTVEEQGGLATVTGRLQKTFGKSVSVEPTSRTMPQGPIPWFTSAYVDNGLPYALQAYFMEIDPSYLAARHPGARIDQPLSREQYLSWDFHPGQALENVTVLTVALSPDESSSLATELEAVGWKVQRGAGGFLATGAAVKVRVVPAGARAGIQQVEFRLRSQVPSRTIRLGNAELHLSGTTGQLVFWNQESGRPGQSGH